MDFLSKVYGEFGLFGLAIVAIILIIYFLIKNQNKNIHNGFEVLSNNIITGMNSQNQLFIEALKENESKIIDSQNNLINKVFEHQKENHNEKIDERTENLMKISGLLNELLVIYNCKRAALIEFHNSKENLNGLPFLWYDIQQEEFQKGTDAISGKCKDMQAAILIYVINIVKENKLCILDNEELSTYYNKSSVLYNYLVEKLEITGICYVPLFNKRNRLSGMLALEYKDINIHDINFDNVWEYSLILEKLLEIKQNF